MLSCSWSSWSLGLASINMSRFKPHSIRASSTSAAALAKVLLDTILWTAGWSGTKVLQKNQSKNMRIWQKLTFDGNSIELSWGARDHLSTFTCVWNKPTQFKFCSPFKVDFWDWIAQSHVIPCTHDDSIELPSNFNLQVSRVNLLIYWATYVKRSEYAQWTNLIMGCNASKIAERLKSSGRKKLLSARCFDIFLLSNILLVEIKRSFWWSDLDFRNNKRKCTFDQFQKAEINYDETLNERISELKSFYELYISQSLRI